MESPTMAYPGTPARANQRRNTFLAIGCGLLFVLGACACMFAGVVSLGLLSYIGGTPDNLSVEYDLPAVVDVGEEFELKLTLTNSGSSDMEIGDIDLDEAYSGSILDGAIVLGTDPDMERDYSLDGIKTFRYNRTLPAGATRRVTFEMQATQPGEYGGSVGVYVGAQAFRIETITLTITER